MMTKGLIFSLLYFHLSAGLVNNQVLPYAAYTDYLEERERGVEEMEVITENSPEYFLAAIEMMRKEMVSPTIFPK